MKNIDAEKLIVYIERLKTIFEEMSAIDGPRKEFFRGKREMAIQTLGIITSLQQEQPEYGYLSTTYIYGKRARWNVGDTLAYYLCTSNEEGEYVIGKVSNVEFDNEEGWLYTFENEDVYDEQSLVEEEVYKIIENGK